jgi:hypothetical protein
MTYTLAVSPGGKDGESRASMYVDVYIKYVLKSCLQEVVYCQSSKSVARRTLVRRMSPLITLLSFGFIRVHINLSVL